MLKTDSELTLIEPDTCYCVTERITTELSRCSRNNNLCKYGLQAGTTSTYCLHESHLKFRKEPDQTTI